jgi:hypothetical protein
MFQRNKAFYFFGTIAAMAWFPLSAQTNPSLRGIDSLWRAFCGAPTHQCIVVYNKMAGGTTAYEDVSKDTLCIMRLISANKTATIKNLFPYAQCQSPYGASYWGVTSGYAISRDGSRLAAQNCHGVIVCDSSGSHMKVISTSDINNDCVALSFDDTVQNGTTVHRIVYAAMPWVILRTSLSDTNTAVKTDTLWKRTDLDPCYGSASSTMGYTSVNKNGRYLSFNVVVQSGACIPVVVNLDTKEYQLPLGGCYTDGCQIRSCWDTAGTVSFHVWGHRIPTTLWQWNTPGGMNTGTIPCPVDPVNCSVASGDPGQGGYYWCETDTNYLIQTGDNDVINSPGCYSKAYLRKGKTNDPPQVLYLGDYFGWPAMWIDPAPFSSGVIRSRAPSSDHPTQVTIMICGNMLTLSGPKAIRLESGRIIDVKGAVVARAAASSANTHCYNISHLSTGVYLVSWRESNVEKSRIVTIAR